MKATSLLTAFILIALVSFEANGAGSEEFVGGPENAAIIAAPDSVRAWRTVASLDREHAKFEDYYHGFGERIAVSTNLAAQLSKLLSNQDTYRPRNRLVKLCGFEPGIVITFSKGNRSLHLFFCFDCNMLEIKEKDGPPSREQKLLSRADFDPGRPKLLGVIKEIFPKDSQIQSLKEKRMKTIALLAAIISIALGHFTAKAGGAEDLVGGPENAAIIAAPDSVKAWRTVGSLQTNHSYVSGAYYQKFGEATPVSTNLAGQLAAVVLNTNSYLHNMSSGCIAKPGVVVSFFRGKRSLDLFFCFECGILLIDSAPDTRKWPSETNRAKAFLEYAKAGTNNTAAETNLPPKYIRAPSEPHKTPPDTMGALLFAPGQAELLGLIKQIFPKDSQIQSL